MAKPLSKFVGVQITPANTISERMQQEQITPVTYSSDTNDINKKIDRRLQALLAASNCISYWGTGQGMNGTKDIIDCADRFMHYALTGKHP